MRILNFLRKIKKRFNSSSDSLLRIEINSQNILHNIFQFRSRYPKHQIAAVLKSNAYGHGLKEIGLLLDKHPVIKYFVVDSLVEAQLLRSFGVKKQIIILGYVLESGLSKLKKIKNIILVVNSLEQAKILKDKIDFPLEVHLKVDTGMNRQGIEFNSLEKSILILKEHRFIKICGLMTHLADAGNLDEIATLKQLKVWGRALEIYKKYFSSGEFHFAATAGTRYLGRAESNLIRLGIGMYGFENRDDEILDLKPALSFWAKVVNVKNVKKGEGIGYDFSFITDRDMKIAILPCGYYEGIPRELSNRGFVCFNNQKIPFVGKISMNLSAVDISKYSDFVLPETELEIISENKKLPNYLANHAKLSNKSVYEILCHLSSGIRRVIK